MKVFILLALFSLSLFSVDAFIGAEELQSKMKHEKLVILDVGSQTLYNKSHIPTAQHVEIQEWCKRVGEHYEMQDVHQLVKLVRQLGINNDSHVVVYDHNSPDGLLNASYLALALHRLGHDKLSILNGGYDEWLYEYKGVQNVVKKVGSDFVANAKKDLIVDDRFVMEHIDKITMLDARVSKYYFGTYKSSGVYRLGHIKGAVSTYWKNSFLSDNTLAEMETLQAIFLHGLRLEKDDEVLLYGLDGYQASMNWYILSRVFGFENLRVYDASMQEWGNSERSQMVSYAWESPK